MLKFNDPAAIAAIDETSKKAMEESVTQLAKTLEFNFNDKLDKLIGEINMPKFNDPAAIAAINETSKKAIEEFKAQLAETVKFSVSNKPYDLTIEPIINPELTAFMQQQNNQPNSIEQYLSSSGLHLYKNFTNNFHNPFNFNPEAYQHPKANEESHKAEENNDTSKTETFYNLGTDGKKNGFTFTK